MGFIILACSRISKCWKSSALISHGRHSDLDSRVLVTFSCRGLMLFFIKFSCPRAQAALSISSHVWREQKRKAMRASVACCHLATDQYQRLQTAQLKSPDGDLGMLSWPWSFSALLYRLTAHAHFHNLLREACHASKKQGHVHAQVINQSRKASRPSLST